ncbi:hypothetical protein BGAL_0799g00020 [Botrytis galanthina]|uniref:SAGA-associated factor 11 n=1 Tax=Botrytis galanthina TaxID=278940 RepID=A0A4S8QHG1_9HELO|nr:hypothetical protein BGAL_0799g00020 [Botrytis galanthina]
MSANDQFPQSGIIIAGQDEEIDTMGKLTNSVLDDIFYNIIHDIVLQTHREEKIAKACSAAIAIEQKVAETNPDSIDDPTSWNTNQIIETDAAKWENKEVFLKGNPLELVDEIICAKCGLPRLLQPTDGVGAKKPPPGKEFCKKKPFIEKPWHDVYGQTYVPEGPGRGKKKKDMINPLLQQQKEGTPNSQDGEDEGPAKPISFPHAKCHNCNTFLPIKRMNNHMVKCIGGGGRDSARAAAFKINGNGLGTGNNSQNGTPPLSRQATPQPNGGKRGSPNKREAADDPDFESDSPQKKKKFLKKPGSSGGIILKNKLKAQKITKTPSQLSSSNLSFEHKRPDSDDDNDSGDDDRDGEYGRRTSIEPKKKMLVNKTGAGIVKKNKDGGGLGIAGLSDKKKKKLLLGRPGSGSSTPVLKPGSLPMDEDRERERKKIKNGNGSGTLSAHKRDRERERERERDRDWGADEKSESSQTLSSPN